VPQPKSSADRTATFGEVFAVAEFRALYSASALSWFGDYLARAAVTALVYGTTGSVALSAASFATGYLPGLSVGPFLAALAERYPRRTVMIVCDTGRACLFATVAIPGLPVPVMFVLLLVAAMMNAPFDASRSALLAQILSGDTYIVAVSAQNTTTNLAMVLGYCVGGIAAPTYPHVTLAFDACTFVVSALLIRYGTLVRPAALALSQRTGLFKETGAGFRLVASNRLLRAIAIISLGATLLAIVPEGLAAAWAARLTTSSSRQGLDQALIMMSVPFGLIVGALVVGRLLTPGQRRQLIRPFAITVPIALTLALLDPSVAGAAAIGFVIGVAVTGLFLPANGLYAQALPTQFRARAFGVFQFGAQLVQAVGLLVTGVLCDHFPLHVVIGAWGAMGIVLMIGAAAIWPATDQIDGALADAQERNAVTAELQAAEVAPIALPQATTSTGGEPADPGADRRQPRPRPANSRPAWQPAQHDARRATESPSGCAADTP
jgi:MFS family permease